MLGTTVALGLGSNLGNSLGYLRQALSAIKQLKNFSVLKVSSIYESDAQTPDGAPAEWNKKYLNAVVVVGIDGTPEPLKWLDSLKKVECVIGRKDKDIWAPREIDIDILWWNRSEFQAKELQIPHLRLLERPFALLPLLEVMPELQEGLKQNLPDWSRPWISKRPFNTKISSSIWPELVGILNITPDSFSDGGKCLDEDIFAKQLQKFAASGVSIIDFGAESTRPNAAVVSPEEELKRLIWAFDILKKQDLKFQVSLDCRHVEVAEKILEEHKVDFLNDVSGFETLPMQQLLKQSGSKAFVMHSLSIPPSKDKVLSDSNSPQVQLIEWWERKQEQLINGGVVGGQLIFDPGIGFGKTAQQSLYILNHLSQFSGIKSDIMIGHSRKSFQSTFSDRPAQERDVETALVTKNLNLAYVQYLRVHDPQLQKMALKARSYLC